MTAELFKASNFSRDGKDHILLAATGSVATIKLPLIARALAARDNTTVRILISESASSFLAGQSDEQLHVQSLLSIPGVEAIYEDAAEWAKPWVRGDPILHIELRRWADIMVIAPLSANALAGIIGGFSNSLILSVTRAWDSNGTIDGKEKKILVAPAMNTAMWEQPITGRQIRALREDWPWIQVFGPIEKMLACGDSGNGAMMAWEKIVQKTDDLLRS